MANTPGSRVVLAGPVSAAGPSPPATLYPLTRTLFVDSGTATPGAQQDGQEWTPFDTVQKAATAIGTAAAGSTWEVVVRRSDGGAVSLPAGRFVVLRGAGWRETTLGALSWATSGADAGGLVLRDLQTPSIAVTGTGSIQFLRLERALCSGALTVAGGVTNQYAYLDSASTQLCRDAGMTFPEATVAPYVDQQSGPFDLDDGPLEGAIYRISAAGPQAQYANAAGAVDEGAAIGTYNNLFDHLLCQDGLARPVLFRDALTLAVGDLAYVSPDVSGRATNVEPTASGHLIVPVGTVLDASGYSGAEGLALVLWRRGEVVQIP